MRPSVFWSLYAHMPKVPPISMPLKFEGYALISKCHSTKYAYECGILKSMTMSPKPPPLSIVVQVGAYDSHVIDMQYLDTASTFPIQWWGILTTLFIHWFFSYNDFTNQIITNS